VYQACRGGRTSLWRWVGLPGAVALVAVVGASRIYLGAHYPSDVVAALLAGTAWACGCVTLFSASGLGHSPHAGPHHPPGKHTA